MEATSFLKVRKYEDEKYIYIFPSVLIILDVLAGAVFLCHGDIKKFIYWMAAAVLNITVTF